MSDKSFTAVKLAPARVPLGDFSWKEVWMLSRGGNEIMAMDTVPIMWLRLWTLCRISDQGGWLWTLCRIRDLNTQKS